MIFLKISVFNFLMFKRNTISIFNYLFSKLDMFVSTSYTIIYILDDLKFFILSKLLLYISFINLT